MINSSIEHFLENTLWIKYKIIHYNSDTIIRINMSVL